MQTDGQTGVQTHGRSEMNITPNKKQTQNLLDMTVGCSHVSSTTIMAASLKAGLWPPAALEILRLQHIWRDPEKDTNGCSILEERQSQWFGLKQKSRM